MAERKFFSGKTIDLAVLAAARFHQIEPEKLAYTPREKKTGFIRRGRRVVIEVDPENPIKTADSAPEAEVPVQASESRKGPNVEDRNGARVSSQRTHEQQPHVQKRHDGGPSRKEEVSKAEVETGWWSETVEGDQAAIEKAVQQIVDLAEFELSWTIREDSDGVHVEFEGEDGEYLTDDDGEVLDAIEHILPRVARGWSGKGVICKVDCEGFRAGREESLSQRAIEAVQEIRETGDAVVLEPMKPADRRIVHMTLADISDIETKSEGDGLYKRVRIRPA